MRWLWFLVGAIALLAALWAGAAPGDPDGSRELAAESEERDRVGEELDDGEVVPPRAPEAALPRTSSPPLNRIGMYVGIEPEPEKPPPRRPFYARAA